MGSDVTWQTVAGVDYQLKRPAVSASEPGAPPR